MALTFDKLSDSGLDPLPAYYEGFVGAGGITSNSPSGKYACGYKVQSGDWTDWLVDCSTRPPSLVWKDNILAGSGNFVPNAVDDEGTIWGGDGSNNGVLYSVPADTRTASSAFTWTDDGGKSQGLSVSLVWTLTLSTSAIKIVLLPEGTVGADQTLVYLGTKGGGSLTKFDTATTGSSWVVWDAFIDDHDDVWVTGAEPGVDSSTFYAWRLTNISGTNPYTSFQSFTMPAARRLAMGYFSAGSYVGGWMDINFQADYLFAANLTTNMAATRDMTATPLASFGISAAPTSPDHWYLTSVADTDNRTMVEVTPTLVDGETWDLDTWAAGDDTFPGTTGDGMVHWPVYLAGQRAFCGTRWGYDSDADLYRGDFFEYYINDAPAPEGRPLRAWTITQDDHDFYIIRLDDESYIFDKLTSQWCQWASPGLTYYSGSDGCDWQGFNVCCDPDNGDIHQIDPTGRLDAGTTPISTRVYGFVTTRFRKNVPMFMAEAAISEGRPPTGVDATTLGIKLRTSDTLTWTDHGTVPGKAAGSMVTARWYGLGVASAPGIEFELSDTGYARRLDGFTIELGAAAEAAISNGQ